MPDQVPTIYYDLQVAYAGGGQCDCGLHAPMDIDETDWRRRFRLKALSPDQEYRLDTRLRRQAITAHGEAYTAVYVPSHSRIAVINPAAVHLLDAFEHGTTPHAVAATSPHPDTALSVLDACYRLGYLVDPSDQLTAHHTQSQTLTVWLHVTNACSLSCAYCYVDQTGRQQMDVETGQRALDTVFHAAAQHNYRAVRLKYAGGEPTLAWDLVTALHAQAAQLAANRHVTLWGIILSNGLHLTAPILKQMKDAQLALTISLDGLGQSHDQQRASHSGSASAQIVKAKIDLALEHGIRPHISITLTRNNITDLPELVQWLNVRELSFTLNFYRAHAPEFLRFELDNEVTINTLRRVFQQAGEADPPRRSWLDTLDRANLHFSHLTPCALGDDYMVIDHQGNLARCQMMMSDSAGSIFDADPLKAIRSMEQGVANVSVEDKEGCKTCEWRYWCAGGCPLETYVQSGRVATRSPHCAIYSALFPHLIELEATRLAHYRLASEDRPPVFER
jgi:uncharacterized protein